MKRICPMPNVWNRRHKSMVHLSETRNLPAPPTPLILAGWNFSDDREKEERWAATVAWCVSHDCLELADNIPDSDWHLGE